MNELSSRGGRSALGERLAFAAAIGVSVACALPPIDIPLGFRSLDTDWFYVLHAAAAAGIVHGRDIHFTYGPLGFLTLPQYHPATWAWMLGVWTVLGVIGGSVWWAHLRSVSHRPWLRASLVWLAMAVGTGEPIRDAWVFSLAVLMVLGAGLATDGRPKWQQPATALGLGILALTKFTFFVAGAATVLLASVFEVIRRRRPDSSPFIYAATVLALWMLLAGGNASILEFVTISLKISAGYGSAMGHARDSVDGGAGDLLGYVVASIVLIATAFRSSAHLRALLGFSLALLFYFVWKAAFVRHDLPHVMIAAEFLLLAALGIGAAVKGRTGRLPRVAVVIPLAIALFLAGVGWGTSASELTDPTLVVKAPVRNVQIAAIRMRQPENARREWREWNRLTRRDADLSAVDGAFDVYPWGQSIGFAWGVPLRPRPVPASYAAFTDELALRNARHLRGSAAPVWLAFRIQTIDDRWPASDDAASWLAILERYEPVARSNEFLLLRRQHQSRRIDVSPLVTVDAEMRTRYDLSRLGNEPLWISFEFRPTTAGMAAALLLRTAPLHLRVQLSGEELPRIFRIVPGTASTGFLLSPFIEDADGFAALMAGESIDKRPLWIEVDSGFPRALWSQSYGLTIDRVAPPGVGDS